MLAGGIVDPGGGRAGRVSAYPRPWARLAAGLLLGVALATSGCGSSGNGGNQASGGSGGDAGLFDGAPPDGQSVDSAPPPDGSDAAGMDAAADHAASDAANDGSPGGDGSAPDASCQPQLIFLAQAGTTSACSFPVPATVDHNQVNVLMGGELCRQGSNNCGPQGGWFWIGNEVALCDDTCLAWDNSGGKLYLEVGCPSESCYVACSKAGGKCGNGINHCCVGTRCENGTCAACGKGGDSCSSTSDCCSGGSCQGGSCIFGMGGPCTSTAGCSQGVCKSNGVCGCDTGQILCNSGCVSYTDPNNCRGCGNVCASNLICTTAGCVCDPAKGLPDLCNGVCVDKSSDRTNCGACSHTCPRLDQVCISSKCQCPAGQTDCNGNCVDTKTSQTHCGGCNQPCATGREVCQGGSCVCASGYTDCSGTCVNLLTDKYNCGSCGNACKGNKLCVNGAC